MANKITAEINTLESQGKALGQMWKRIVKSDMKQITDFDLELGKLLMAIRAEFPNNPQLPKARLQECSVNNIDRRRRNEALQLAQNWNHPVMQELFNSKRFTSCATLVREFAKQTKEDDTPAKTAEQLAKSVVSLLEKNGVALDAFAKALASEYAAQSEETGGDIETDKVAA